MMDRGDALSAIAYLAAMTTGWNDDSTEGYVREIEQCDEPEAMMDACQEVARTWVHLSRPPLAVIWDEYNAQVRRRHEKLRETAAMSALRCGGYGWVRRGNVDAPCPTCNPAMLAVWSDRTLRARWRHGEPMHKLLDCDTRAEYVAEWERSPCPKVTDVDRTFDEHELTPDRGRDAALTAYRETFEREPTVGAMAWLASLG